MQSINQHHQKERQKIQDLLIDEDEEVELLDETPTIKKGTQRTLSETVRFLHKRAALSPTGSPNKTMKLDPNNRFSILDDAEEEEDEVANDEITELRKKDIHPLYNKRYPFYIMKKAQPKEKILINTEPLNWLLQRIKVKKKKGKKGKETSKDSKAVKETNQKDQPGSPRNADETKDTGKPQGTPEEQHMDPPETSRDTEDK